MHRSIAYFCSGLLLLWILAPTLLWGYPFERHVKTAAAKYNVEEAFIRAIIKAESDFDQYAQSSKGGLGLMQLLITTARQYEPRVARFQLLEEADLNIDIATRHLKGLERQVRRRYPRAEGLDRLRLIAAAYNAGWSRVIRAGGQVPQIWETQTYSRRVLRYYRTYGGRHKPAPALAGTDQKPVPVAPTVATKKAPPAGNPVKTAGALTLLGLLHVGFGWIRLRALGRARTANTAPAQQQNKRLALLNHNTIQNPTISPGR